MTQSTLSATIRGGRGKGPARQLRMSGNVPAVVYGLGAENQSIAVDAHQLDKILHSTTGVNSVIKLQVEGSRDQLVLTRQIVRHPVRSTLTHVDFIRVSADIDITADVTLRMEGSPEGVRLGGKFEQLLFAVGVSCRPDAVPPEIEIDISGLGLGDQIHVRDLVVPAGVTFTQEADTLIAQVVVPRGLAAEGEEDAAAAAE